MTINPYDIDFTDIPWNHSNKKTERLFIELSKGIVDEKEIVKVRGEYYFDDIIPTLHNIVYTNPLAFPFRELICVEYDGKYTEFHLGYRNESKEWRSQLIKRVNDLYHIMEIDHCQSDLEKELAVNDWLIKNTEWIEEGDFHIRHSVIGILLEGKGVCASYALTTALLLRCFGMTSHVVLGKLKGEERTRKSPSYRVKDFFDNYIGEYCFHHNSINHICPDYTYNDYIEIRPRKKRMYCDLEKFNQEAPIGHAWNYVVIGDKERQLDVTFNAGTFTEPWYVSKHKYFNLTLSEMKREREISFGPKK